MKKITLLILCLVSLSSQAEVKHISEFGFIVENRFTTAQPVEKVWQALVEDVDLWWPKDHSWWGESGKFTIDPRAGGCFCEFSGNNSAEHMHINFVEPNKLLRMTGGLGPLQGMGMFGALDWQFSQDQGNTTVTLRYAVNGINPDGFEKLAPIVAKVQGIQLDGLRQYVEASKVNR